MPFIFISLFSILFNYIILIKTYTYTCISNLVQTTQDFYKKIKWMSI